MSTLDEILSAVYRKDLAALARLSGDDVDARDDDLRTPLVHAVLASDADPTVVGLLIDRGADVDAADRQGWNPLHFAARDQKTPVVRALLDLGAAVDAVDSDGDTPLWHAVMTARSDLSTIRELVANGADPHHRNCYGVNPAEVAATVGATEITALFDGRAAQDRSGC